MSFSHCAQKLVRYNTSMDFTPQNNLPQTHHVLRFVFAAVVALVVVILGYWLYQNKFFASSAKTSTQTDEMPRALLPEPIPANETEQKFANDILLKISTENTATPSAKAEANYQQNINALPNSN